MQIEELRDLVIVISGIIVTLTIIIISVFLYSAYRKVNDILKSTKAAAAKIEEITVIAGDELGKPLTRAINLIQGITLGIHEIGRIFRKGGEDGKEG